MNLKCKLPNFFKTPNMHSRAGKSLALILALGLVLSGAAMPTGKVNGEEVLKCYDYDNGSMDLADVIAETIKQGCNALKISGSCSSVGPKVTIGKELKEILGKASFGKRLVGNNLSNSKIVFTSEANITVKNIEFVKARSGSNGCTVEIEKGAQVTFENCTFNLPPVNRGQITFKGCQFGEKGIMDYASDTTKYLSSDGQTVQGPTNGVPTLTLTKPTDADKIIADTVAGQFGKNNPKRILSLAVPYTLGGTAAANAQVTATVGKKGSTLTPVEGLTAKVIAKNSNVKISNTTDPASGSGEPTVTEIPAGEYTIRIAATAAGASPETATIEYNFTIPPKDDSQPQPPVPGPNPDPHQPQQQPSENNIEFVPEQKKLEIPIGETKDFTVKLSWKDKTTGQESKPKDVRVDVSYKHEIISQNRDASYMTAKYDKVNNVLKIHQDAQAPAGTYLIQLTATFDNNQTSKNTIQLIVKNKPAGGTDNNNPGSSSPSSKSSSYFDLRAIPFACETCPKAKTSAKKDDVPDTAAAARLFCSLN
ncbi:hypothetical protein B7R76_05890 [Mageeibacillus indolicus]|uniref:Uncharacterized protein n=1 Tax=Mageeibacillus indolicus TaxID=884684 RepID=A0A2J8B0T2_9FIRM|nr:hypothetical protein [Mageeibacillus indolicus]PNH18372.1 hypothetical protein B7R76_05890 [Mageeibacillus indolicus]